MTDSDTAWNIVTNRYIVSFRDCSASRSCLDSLSVLVQRPRFDDFESIGPERGQSETSTVKASIRRDYWQDRNSITPTYGQRKCSAVPDFQTKILFDHKILQLNHNFPACGAWSVWIMVLWAIFHIETVELLKLCSNWQRRTEDSGTPVQLSLMMASLWNLYLY